MRVPTDDPLGDDPWGDATAWTAVQADGSPSTDLVIAADHEARVDVSARIMGTGGARGHALRRTIPPADLSGFTELRMSIRSDRRAGVGGGPFFLELRLGSVARPVGVAGWHRLLPVVGRHSWETVQLGLDDLDPPVRSAVTEIELRCVDADPPFVVHLADMTAVRPRMLVDADRALVGALEGIRVGDTAVVVAVRAPAEPVPDAPAIDLTQVDVRYAPERIVEGSVMREFTRAGVRAAPLGEPYDLDYLVTAIASTRTAQAALLEAVLDRLSPLDRLAVDGAWLPVEQVHVADVERVAPVLRYRVRVRRSPAAVPVHPIDEVGLQVGHLEVG